MLPLLLIAIHKKGGDSAKSHTMDHRSIPYNLLYNAKGATRGTSPLAVPDGSDFATAGHHFQDGIPLIGPPSLYLSALSISGAS